MSPGVAKSMVPPPLLSAASTAARRLQPLRLTQLVSAGLVRFSSMVVVTVIPAAPAGLTPMPVTTLPTTRLRPKMAPAVARPARRQPCRVATLFTAITPRFRHGTSFSR